MIENTPEVIKAGKSDFSNFFHKRKILCRVWMLGINGARDKLVGQRKVTIGKTNFDVKGKRYWIDYNLIKEGNKYFEYDCNVLNAIGGLSWHEVHGNKVSPNQASLMLKDGMVTTFMGKSGIPAMYILVAFIAVSILAVGLVYIVGQYQNSTVVIKNLETKNSALLAENNQLKGLNPDGGNTVTKR